VAFPWVRPKQVRDEEIDVFYFASHRDDGDGDHATLEAEDDTGEVLGDRFELLEAIGWGGTAAVYRALDQVTKAQVAVKVLSTGVRDQLGRYFGQEARLAAQLFNPHLVRAHHFGIDDGRPFIVFDLVPGRSLPALYFMQPMPWRELCEVVLDLLDALGTLHSQGIVHRDVKPDNIVVWRRGDHPAHVTLLDLGFAAVPPERKITNAPEPTRKVFGTAGYIAPELFAGHLPDPRSDLYSVGALMYEMLTSLPVTDISNAPDLLAIAPPRVVAPGVDIPEAVEDIVMRALSDIEARFQSAAEMAATIRMALAPRPATTALSARSPPPPPAARRSWSVPVSLGLGVLLGSLGTVGWMSWTADQPEQLLASVETLPIVPDHALATPTSDPPTEPTSTPSNTTQSTPEVQPVPNSSIPPPSQVTVEKPRRRVTGVQPRDFRTAMARLEPAVRDCARTSGIGDDAVKVEVRRTGTKVDSVRVWDMSTKHPFVKCVDGLVRSAVLPGGGSPVESFQYLGDRVIAENSKR
jgi:serine/threonine protein kinase